MKAILNLAKRNNYVAVRRDNVIYLHKNGIDGVYIPEECKLRVLRKTYKCANSIDAASIFLNKVKR